MTEKEKTAKLAELSLEKSDEKASAQSSICPWIDKIVLKRFPDGKERGRSNSVVQDGTGLQAKHKRTHKPPSTFCGKRFSLSKFSHFMPSNSRRAKTTINNFKKYNKEKPSTARMCVENSLNSKFKPSSVGLRSSLPSTKQIDTRRRYRRHSASKQYSVDHFVGIELFPAQNEPSIWQIIGQL